MVIVLRGMYNMCCRERPERRSCFALFECGDASPLWLSFAFDRPARSAEEKRKQKRRIIAALKKSHTAREGTHGTPADRGDRVGPPLAALPPGAAGAEERGARRRRLRRGRGRRRRGGRPTGLRRG